MQIMLEVFSYLMPLSIVGTPLLILACLEYLLSFIFLPLDKVQLEHYV